jgi:Beta- N-acetylglucosaminidase
MKKTGPQWVITMLVVLNIVVASLAFNTSIELESDNKVKAKENTKENTKEVASVKVKNDTRDIKETEIVEVALNPEPTPEPEPIVYDGLTMAQLSAKLDRSLASNLSGYGYVFASRSIEKGVDPYMAVSIALHETGCTWGCSAVLRQCNNVAGMKGSPSCMGYKSFPTLEQGIIGFIDYLSDNYIKYGLTTPAAINPKYAEDRGWAGKVNTYIAKVRAS